MKRYIVLAIALPFFACATAAPKPLAAEQAMLIIPTPGGAPTDLPYVAKAGSVMPAEAVCMTAALAAFKAGNCTSWEEAGTSCLKKLAAQPAAPDALTWTIVKVAAGVVVGGAVGAAIGYAAHK